MLDNALMLRLCARYVLRDGERIERAREWPGRVAALVHTDAGRVFLVEPSTDLALARAPWVAEVVVAQLQADCGGPAGEGAFVVFSDGRAMSLTDPGAVAYLAGALHTGMDPVAYAEVLLRWHPWTRAERGLGLRPDEPSGQGAPADLAPPVLEPSGSGRRLVFHSWSRYAHGPHGALRLDAHEWTVDVPYEGLAHWSRRPVVGSVPAVTR